MDCPQVRNKIPTKVSPSTQNQPFQPLLPRDHTCPWRKISMPLLSIQMYQFHPNRHFHRVESTMTLKLNVKDHHRPRKKKDISIKNLQGKSPILTMVSSHTCHLVVWIQVKVLGLRSWKTPTPELHQCKYSRRQHNHFNFQSSPFQRRRSNTAQRNWYKISTRLPK